MDFDQKVDELVQQGLPGTQVDIRKATPVRRLSGIVVGQGFEGQEPLDRQTRIWELLRQGLGPDAQRISILLAYTPHGWASFGAG